MSPSPEYQKAMDMHDDEMLTQLAQGLINIDEETHNTFERGCLFHIAVIKAFEKLRAKT